MCRKSNRILLALLLACLWALPAYSQSQETESQNILTRLQKVNSILNELETRLQERKQDTLKLQSDLIALSTELTAARQLLDESQTDLTETRNLLDSLTERYNQLLTVYKTQSRKNKIELWIWRGVTVAELVAIIALAASR
jgi:septal ring factor EnvC (AmiA/AmiB activator)